MREFRVCLTNEAKGGGTILSLGEGRGKCQNDALRFSRRTTQTRCCNFGTRFHTVLDR